MKRKVVREVEVIVKIVESKKCFKLKVDDDIRIKTVANKLCTLMGLDPISTEWAFFMDADAYYEIPISYTLKQVAFKGERRVLLAKIMTTMVRQNYFLEQDIKIRMGSSWVGKSRPFTKSVEIQTDADPSENPEKIKQIIKNAKPRVIYTIDGILKPFKPAPVPPRIPLDVDEIWTNLKTIQFSRIMRGLNVVGYCGNFKCINYMRWICVSMGFGR